MLMIGTQHSMYKINNQYTCVWKNVSHTTLINSSENACDDGGDDDDGS